MLWQGQEEAKDKERGLGGFNRCETVTPDMKGKSQPSFLAVARKQGRIGRKMGMQQRPVTVFGPLPQRYSRTEIAW